MGRSRGKLILVTGGVRSGKSDFAERYAARSDKEVVYLATGEARDLEMRHQIEERRRRRPGSFQVLEEPLHPGRVLERGTDTTIFIIDCLTTLLSNHLQQQLTKGVSIPWEKQLEIFDAIMEGMDDLTGRMLNCPADVIAVTSEAGWGVVPDSIAHRLLRNLTGKTNQLVAARADEVWLTICGIARRFK